MTQRIGANPINRTDPTGLTTFDDALQFTLGWFAEAVPPVIKYGPGDPRTSELSQSLVAVRIRRAYVAAGRPAFLSGDVGTFAAAAENPLPPDPLRAPMTNQNAYQ